MYTYSTEESAYRSERGLLLLKPDKDAPRGLKFMVPFRNVEELVCDNTKIYQAISEADHADWYEKGRLFREQQKAIRETALAKLTDAEKKALNIR